MTILIFLLISINAYSGSEDFKLVPDKKNKKLKIIHFKGKKYLQGKVLGKGAMGHVDLLIPVPSINNLTYVIKNYTFVGKNILGMYKVEKELAMELSKYNLVPETYFNDKEKSMIKKLIHGPALSGLLEKFDKARNPTPWKDPSYPKLVDFMAKLFFTIHPKLEKENKFLWDLHLNNLMYDLALKRWYIVDANWGRDRAAELVRVYKGKRGIYQNIFQDWCGSYSGMGIGKKKKDGIGRSVQYLDKFINKLKKDLSRRGSSKIIDYFFTTHKGKDFSQGKYCKAR